MKVMREECRIGVDVAKGKMETRIKWCCFMCIIFLFIFTLLFIYQSCLSNLFSFFTVLSFSI